MDDIQKDPDFYDGMTDDEIAYEEAFLDFFREAAEAIDLDFLKVSETRLTEMTMSALLLGSILSKSDSDAKIERGFNKLFGSGGITIKCKNLSVHSIENFQSFVKVVRVASDIDIMPMTNGGLSINIGFGEMFQPK